MWRNVTWMVIKISLDDAGGGPDEMIRGRVTYVNADVVLDALLSKTSFRNSDIS